MPARNGRTPEQVRRDIETEREQLASAVESLREEVGEAANVTAKLRGKLPVVAAGAAGAGFILAGRLPARRPRRRTARPPLASSSCSAELHPRGRSSSASS